MKLSCNTCGLVIPPANVNLAEGVCFCPHCEDTFKLTTANVTVEIPSGAVRPAATRIEFVSDDDTLGLIIPGGNNRRMRGIFIACAVIFNAFTALVVMSALLPGVKVSVAGACFFVVLGLALAALALFMARGEFTLAVNRRECTAMWTLYHWNHTRRVPASGITAVAEQEIYRTNGRPRYAILIRHPNRSILFGATLTDEERRWIVRELRQFLRLRNPAGEPIVVEG